MHSFQLPLPPFSTSKSTAPPFPLQKSLAIPEMTSKNYRTRYNKTRQKPLHQGWTKHPEIQSFSLLEFSLTKHQANSDNMYLKDLVQTHASHLLAASGCVSPSESCLAAYVFHALLVSWNTSDSYNLSSLSYVGFHKLWEPNGDFRLLLWKISAYGLCTSSHLLQKEASLMKTGQGTDLLVWQDISRHHLIFFFCQSYLALPSGCTGFGLPLL